MTPKHDTKNHKVNKLKHAKKYYISPDVMASFVAKTFYQKSISNQIEIHNPKNTNETKIEALLG